MADEPLDLRRKYWLKHGTRQTTAKVKAIDSILDVNTQQRHAGRRGLKLNDIARIELTVQQPLAADAYDDIRATGAFILIDEVTHQTVAAGMIRLDVPASAISASSAWIRQRARMACSAGQSLSDRRRPRRRRT